MTALVTFLFITSTIRKCNYCSCFIVRIIILITHRGSYFDIYICTYDIYMCIYHIYTHIYHIYICHIYTCIYDIHICMYDVITYCDIYICIYHMYISYMHMYIRYYLKYKECECVEDTKESMTYFMNPPTNPPTSDSLERTHSV